MIPNSHSLLIGPRRVMAIQPQNKIAFEQRDDVYQCIVADLYGKFNFLCSFYFWESIGLKHLYW
jgi:hypothetical protein